MKGRKALTTTAAIISGILTVLYLVAIILMGNKTSFSIGEGESAVTFNFRPLTVGRTLNWILLFALSLAVTVGLFADGFKNRWVKSACAAIAIIMAVLELVNFLGTATRCIPAGKWTVMCTVDLAVFILRTIVAIASGILAFKAWKKNSASS